MKLLNVPPPPLNVLSLNGLPSEKSCDALQYMQFAGMLAPSHAEIT